MPVVLKAVVILRQFRASIVIWCESDERSGVNGATQRRLDKVVSVGIPLIIGTQFNVLMLSPRSCQRGKDNGTDSLRCE
ncbi:unnamed protein product [Litomosoides sigmodontis]|uniref:Uncharacterized protein n=1 Tax=Litomosoides sigmodontis TaxID=42156 RepID=A0A3P6UPE8_LITSI|nr:unnamed protein product [Litomosoides sigmodontis]